VRYPCRLTQTREALLTRAQARFGVFLLVSSLGAALSRAATGPSFDCARATGKAEQLVCREPALAALDVLLDGVYQAALAKVAPGPAKDTLVAEQAGFRQARDGCARSLLAFGACVEDNYARRISALQTAFALVPEQGRASFTCEGDGPQRIGATFFASHLGTAVLTAGDREVLVFQQPAASGAKYEGEGVVLWNKGDEAQVTWEEIELRCLVAR
jgi:uncharacterized protein